MHQAPPSAIARQWALGVNINTLIVNTPGTLVAAALGDGRLALLAADETPQEPHSVQVHDGVGLSLAACGEAFISGGDDGRLVRIEAGAEPRILHHAQGKWIDHAAADAKGSCIAFAMGKQLSILREKESAPTAPLIHPSSVGGLAFSPNGKRIAASHHNGVSLWWSNAQTQSPTLLSWKGSHLAVSWHPDGKILMTAMQDNALHGWRLSDMNEMRMQGYAGKIHAMDWTPRGKWLATSGAPQAICWPFFGGGPWGKTPLALGHDRGIMARMVAANPKDDLVAIGYQDGMIELAPLDGRPGVMIHPPVDGDGCAVTGLVWNAAGDCLFASTENGYLMLFTVDSVAQAVRQ